MTLPVFTLIAGANGAGKSTLMVHKHFRPDSIKLQPAQKLLEAGTESEAVERPLDLAISEHRRNKLAEEANRRFLRSRIAIRDVFGSE